MSSEINSDISKCPFHGEGIPQNIIREKVKQIEIGGQIA